MPWPPHYHLEWGGSRGSGTDEIWQNGVRLACRFPDVTEPVENVELVLSDLFAFEVRKWFTHEDAMIHPSCRLQWCSLSWILPTGAADRELSARLEYASPAAGAGDAGGRPAYQSSVVLTWRSGQRARGAGSHGRIYSPAPTVETDPSTGLFPADDAIRLAHHAGSLIETLSYDTLFRPKIYAAIVSPRLGGVYSRIDLVTVDNRIDVLRKRGARLEPVRAGHLVDFDFIDP